MTWFTRIIDAVFNRHPATEYSSTRSYIPYGYGDAKLDLTCGDRKELQRLSRYHEAGNAVVNRMADLWECYVVGSQGLQIFPASSSERSISSKRYLDPLNSSSGACRCSVSGESQKPTPWPESEK